MPTHPLESRIEPDVAPDPRSPGRIAREFRALVEGGVPIRVEGGARRSPRRLLSRGYTPRHRIELFGTTFHLTNLRSDINFRFFVAYVKLPERPDRRSGRPAFHARVFYKDSSLVWRSATHCIRTDDENWIGKGDLKVYQEDGVEMEYGAEETTNLPLEVQAALDAVSRRGGAVRSDHRAVPLVLRNAPEDRFEPYADFSAPRRIAMADERNLVNGGEFVATFERPDDPDSLRFVPGYEPDFADGLVSTSELRSRLYGGAVRKHRILSVNREIQYQFIAAPRHVWIIPPQTLTTELSSYGVRTVDVNADENLFVPGYEYHYLDHSEEPPTLHTQIPEGFAGPASDVDPTRADASPWLDALPVIQEFRKHFAAPRS